MIWNLCPDAVPNLLGLFDTSIAPPLLFYSYIPIAMLCVFFGIFVYIKDKNSSLSKYFLGIALSFAIWILLILFQWIGAYLETVHLAWQLLLLPEICIFLFSVHFSYVFLFNKEPPKVHKYISATILIITAVSLPTQANIVSFDINNCEGNVGLIWSIAYIFEWICLSMIILMTIFRINNKDLLRERLKIVLLPAGIVFFLGIFWASNYFGELTNTYEINLVGPIGMFSFLGVLSYMIMKFKIFNAKLFTAEILVGSLWFFVAALLFIRRLEYIQIVVLCTLGLVGLIGVKLIQSVRKEIEQREKVEKLVTELKQINLKLQELDRQKDGVIHLVAHQLKGPVTTIKFTTELLLDGTCGKLTTEQQQSIDTIQTAAQKMGAQSEMVLDAAKITSGKLPLNPEQTDLSDLLSEIVSEAESHAKERKVDLKVSLPNQKLPIAILDKKYTQLSVDNLLSNAIKYSALKGEGGKVDFSVELKKNTLFCSVKDTGVGIPKKEQENIFKELYRAHNAGKEGTGLGLHIAKGAIEAQGGKLSFESIEGKGTTFFIELPLKIPSGKVG